jgi:hypothetical protein
MQLLRIVEPPGNARGNCDMQHPLDNPLHDSIAPCQDAAPGASALTMREKARGFALTILSS